MTTPAPRPGFPALLRANLPSTWWDILAYALIALVLRFLLHLSAGATAAVTGAVILASIPVFAAAQYAMARFGGHAPPPGDDGDGS
jgi:hypothetical protein